MATMQYEQELLDQIRDLPAEQEKAVLDFAAFLRQKWQREEDQLQEERERAAECMDERRERIGPVDIRAADLVEEGRAARIETSEQFERAEEAVAKMKRFLLAACRTHTPEAYAELSAPILRELQERERDILAYLSQVPVAQAEQEPAR